MSAARLNLKIEQGATFSHRLFWKDASRTPIDLTGYLARMHVREDKSSVGILTELTIANNRITLGGVNGTIDLSITATDTAAITWLRGVYDLELESPTGVVTRLVEGTVIVATEVTR